MITGKEPFHPNPHIAGAIGITIYQEAVLRFMVIAQSQWVDPRDAVDNAKRWAEEYIKSLNNESNS